MPPGVAEAVVVVIGPGGDMGRTDHVEGEFSSPPVSPPRHALAFASGGAWKSGRAGLRNATRRMHSHGSGDWQGSQA